ncbi:MAG: hypothetical protein ACRYFU_08855 [Janthinobacterium lividum]
MAGAQTTSPEKPIPNAPGTTHPDGSAPAAGTQSGVTPPQLESGQTTITIDKRLTKQQETQLFADADEIFRFASKDTGLPIEHPVKKIFITRDQVSKELRKRFDEDKGSKKMEQSELVLKKFGLLDRDFQLRPFLLSLLTEQIAGFYDNKTKTMNLLDWVPVDEQKPVMAHELTHALQDQKVDLKHWEDTEPEGTAKNVAEDNKHIQTDEDDTSRDAVLEGQAMVSFADYMLRPMGKTLKDEPQMAAMLAGGSSDMGDSPVLARAPLVLQQSLLFPYTSGLLFEQAMLIKGGTRQAFTGVLESPPSATSQILHPGIYLAHTPVPVLLMPDVHPLLTAAGYEPYDVGVMGELDVRMTAELFGGKPLAEALAPNWAGGIYYAAQRRNATAAQKETTASLALLYDSRWLNSDSAQSFFHVFEEELPRQYDGLKRRPADETDTDERVYSSNEGDVLLRREGNRVWVSEGFELALARKLRASVDGAQGSGPVMQASVPVNSLTGGMAHWIGSFGIMRGGLRF